MTQDPKQYVGKRCAIYEVGPQKITVFGVCTNVTEHDITFNTGSEENVLLMTIPRGKYPIREAKDREERQWKTTKTTGLYGSNN